ncbi:MAG: hypothetical protein RIC19_20895 [Phaeodactylibacter sp.]|uniref:hypothetical protein n=1 Tax=Phaeodactylibacter sp. TaxID=1940289 RepID=UPI0032ED25A6
MTKNTNTPITTEQLLHDDRFVQAVLAGNTAIEAYQQQYLSHLANAGAVINDARRTILSMRQYYQSQSLSSKTKEDLLRKIRSSGRV